MKTRSIVRGDGILGTVVAEEPPGQLVVEFTDGSRSVVSADALVLEEDGRYRLPPAAGSRAGAASSEELVIPVIAEEVTVETHRIARRKVHVHKRIETREEVVATPVIREEVIVERVPVNKVIDDVDVVPTVRDEAGVLVIPLIEEVVVVLKQLVVREEVRVYKRRTTTSPQTVVLRREVVDIQEEDLAGSEQSEDQKQTSQEGSNQP